MKLVRLDATASTARQQPSRVEVPIHPKMTVVLGATGAVRDTLIDAIAGIPRGRASAGGVIEVGGVRADLSDETLARLGLRADLDVVVRATDLPGHDVDADSRVTERRHATIAREEAQRALEHAGAAVEEAGRRVAELDERLEQLRTGGGEAATLLESRVAARAEAGETLKRVSGERAALEEELDRLRVERRAAASNRAAADEAVREASTPVAPVAPAAPPDPTLRARRETLQARIAALEPQDPTPVVTCLDRIEQNAGGHVAPVPAALALADDWQHLRVQLTGLEVHESEDEQQARLRLDAARRAAIEAERDLRVSALSSEAVAALEAAHRAVLDAQDKTNSRFSGARARARLEELRAVEREALDQLGFVTYADYMMSSSSRGVGAGKRSVLQNARLRVAEAEAEWQALGGDASHDARRTELLAQRSSLTARVALVLGHEPEASAVERELRELRAVPPPDSGLVAELRSALIGVGLQVDDPDLEHGELRRLARAWLDEIGTLDRRRVALEAELRGLDEQIVAAGSEGPPAGPSTSAGSARAQDGPTERTLAQARHDLAAAERRLADVEDTIATTEKRHPDMTAQEHAAQARVSELDATDDGPASIRSLLAETGAERDTAGAQLAAAEEDVRRLTKEVAAADDRLAALLAAEEATEARTDAAPGAPRPSPDPAREELMEEIEWYLLARLAAQREVGDAGSIPLVLDDTFRDLHVAEAVRVMEAMERMSGAVQVIAVSDDRALAFWAEALGEDRARVVSVSA